MPSFSSTTRSSLSGIVVNTWSHGSGALKSSHSYWSGFDFAAAGWQGVAVDTHIYQVFNTDMVAWTGDQHIAAACDYATSLSGYDFWVVVGEWSPAATDCAKYLNGRGVGARYDGTHPDATKAVGSCTGLTGSASTFSEDYKQFLAKFWAAQAIAFERGGQGWIQWAWKAENADEWSYQAGLANGWIPRKPTNYAYPSICG